MVTATGVKAVDERDEFSYPWLSGRLALIDRAVRGLAVPPHPRIIDVAAGDGIISEFVRARLDGRLVTHDRSDVEVAASSAAGRNGVVGDALRLPFADRSADVTVAFEIIEHFTREDATRLVDELYRVTARDGVLLLSTPNRYSLESWKGLAKYVVRGTVWNARDETHITIFSRGALLSALRPRFRIERTLGFFLLPEVRGHATPWTYRITTNPLLQRLCHKLFVVGRRRD